VIEDGMWVKGEEVSWEYLVESNEGMYLLPNGKKHYSAPNILESWIYLNLCTVFYLILTWYFDNVL